MRANDPNLPYLRQIAEALGDLREQVVFVGGAVAGLLVTDPLADSVRATRDVDAVVNATRAVFHQIEAAVAERGFARDVQSDVICRWIHKDSGVLFDLMPVQPEVLGFTNRWYPYAVETAESVELTPGLNIRLVERIDAQQVTAHRTGFFEKEEQLPQVVRRGFRNTQDQVGHPTVGVGHARSFRRLFVDEIERFSVQVVQAVQIVSGFEHR